MRSFTEGNTTKHLLAFSVPLLIGTVFQQVYGIVDTVVVGRYVGGKALASVGTSATLLNFLLSLLVGLTTGASVVISQFYGAREDKKLERAVSTSIIFLGILSVIITVVGNIGAPIFLSLLNTPADILDDAVLYLRILMAGVFFLIFYNMYTAYLRALGDSKSPLAILIFSSALNIVLDLVFVIQFGLGVGGVACATIISQASAAVLCYLYVHRHIPLLHISKLVFDRVLFRSILSYSIPAALQLSLTSLAGLTIMRLVNSFGSIAVAGYTAATKIDQLAITPLSNISMAVSTFVAQNIGAGKEERAKRGLRSSLVLMGGIGVFISLFALLFGRQLIALFVDMADADSPDIVEVGAQYLSIIVCFYVLFAVFFAFNGFFRGVGDAVIVMILTITSLTIRAISAYLLVHFLDMGPEAVAWSIPIGWGLCSTAAYIYYKRRMWAGKAVVKQYAVTD